MDFYLITGFLGAGKTTFLKQFIRLFPGKKIALIVNEYGKEGVDGALLEELHLSLREISNGSIFCACRLDKFEEELEKLPALSPDVVITEASGLSDPTNVKRVLAEYPSINYRGSVCLADAVNFLRVVDTARVCPKQLSVSSLVLLNKTDLVEEPQLLALEEKLRALAPFSHIERTSFGACKPEWLSWISPDPDPEAGDNKRDLTLQKKDILLSSQMDSDQCLHLLRLLCEDTYRMKGILSLSDGLFLADCTGASVKLTRWEGKAPENLGHLTLLAGPGMPLRKGIQTAEKLYGSYFLSIS